MPRPEALTPDKRRECIALAHCGLSRRAIAGYVRCAPATIENTARRDPDFAEALAHAASRFVMENMRSIQQQARHSWRAAAWSLERTQPHVFGRRDAGALRPAEQEAQLRRLGDALVAAVPEELREALSQQARRLIGDIRAESLSPHAWDDSDSVSPWPPGQAEDPPASDVPLAGELVRRATASDVPSAPLAGPPRRIRRATASDMPSVPVSPRPPGRDVEDAIIAVPNSPSPAPGDAPSASPATSPSPREYREMPDNRLKRAMLERDPLVRTVPANPATGTPHTTTVVFSLLCAMLLNALFSPLAVGWRQATHDLQLADGQPRRPTFDVRSINNPPSASCPARSREPAPPPASAISRMFSYLPSPRRGRGAGGEGDGVRAAAACRPADLCLSHPAPHPRVVRNSAAVINHNPRTSPINCSTTPRNPVGWDKRDNIAPSPTASRAVPPSLCAPSITTAL